ncbi:MAG: FAD-dependent oxidoreductase [Oscillospiraceae bacterium]|nr:FAD-dependent oxidoreductase [Oscillospiraceae bacterium]
MADYAVIGFGCAGYYGAKTIRENDPDGRITVFSEHGYSPYNPMLTTYYVAGKIPFEGMFPFGDMEKIKKELNLELITEKRVEKVDAETKTVITAEGGKYHFDKILIATGAHAFAPEFEGLNPAEAFYMRTLDDALKLREALDRNNYRTALVAGASMVGIKVVELLNAKGIRTTLADMAQRIFPLAAYENVSKEIERRITEKGVNLALGSALKSVEKTEDTYICKMTDGQEIPADLIVLCIGTRTNVSTVAGTRVKVNRGIIVDNNMQTSVEGVYAAGDVSEGVELQSKDKMIIGLWANAAHQGITAGANMAGGKASFDGNFMHNITHFMDMDFIGFGDNRLTGTVYTSGDIKNGLYVEAVIGENGLVGVNILDNYRISGAVKNYLYRIIESGSATLSPIQKGILIKEGLRPSFIEKMEGKAYVR